MTYDESKMWSEQSLRDAQAEQSLGQLPGAPTTLSGTNASGSPKPTEATSEPQTPARASSFQTQALEILHRTHFEQEWGSLTSAELYEDVPDECQQVINTALTQLTTLIEEQVIGEDGQVTGYMRPQGTPSVDLTESYRNAFRAEQRQALKGSKGRTEDE